MVLPEMLLQMIAARKAMLTPAGAAFLGTVHVAALMLAAVVPPHVGLAAEVLQRLAGIRVDAVAVRAEGLSGSGGGGGCGHGPRG